MNSHFQKLKSIITDSASFFRKLPEDKTEWFVFGVVNIGVLVLLSFIVDLIQRTESAARIFVIPVLALAAVFTGAFVSSAVCSAYKETSSFDLWLKIYFSMTAILPVLGITRFFVLVHEYAQLLTLIVPGSLFLKCLYDAGRRTIQIPARRLGKIYPSGIMILLITSGAWLYMMVNAEDPGYTFDHAAVRKEILYLGHDKARIEIEAKEQTVKNLNHQIENFRNRGISVSEEIYRKLRQSEKDLKNYLLIFDSIKWD